MINDEMYGGQAIRQLSLMPSLTVNLAKDKTLTVIYNYIIIKSKEELKNKLMIENSLNFQSKFYALL